jgi:hypothetical protein
MFKLEEGKKHYGIKDYCLLGCNSLMWYKFTRKSKKLAASILWEDGYSKSLQNNGIFPTDYNISHRRKQ